MKLLSRLALLGSAFLLGCPPDDLPTGCQEILVDQASFLQLNPDPFELKDILIDKDIDCLHITIAYGGGCKNLGLGLVTSGAIIKTNPPKMELRFDFEDDDDCEAYINKTFSFDLSPLQAYSDNELILLFEGFEDTVKYTW